MGWFKKFKKKLKKFKPGRWLQKNVLPFVPGGGAINKAIDAVDQLKGHGKKEKKNTAPNGLQQDQFQPTTQTNLVDDPAFPNQQQDNSMVYIVAGGILLYFFMVKK